MLTGIARFAIVAPRRVIALALLVMISTAIFGVGVTKSLSAGGGLDPGAESSQASALLSSKFDQGDMTMLITVTSDGGAQRGRAKAVGTEIVRRLQDSADVGQVQSAWTVSPSAAKSFVSNDGRTGLIVAAITGGESDAQRNAKQLYDELVYDRDGVTVRAGGDATVYWQVNAQTEKDLLLMEALALPLSFVVLVWVFGGLVAAALPVAVGIFAILGCMASLHAISMFAHVSIFALNLSVAMGMALAIDYTLLILSRFRDELAEGRTRDDALIRTMATAGRTVMFSALDGGAVDGDDGAVSPVLSEVVRLRGCRDRRVHGRGVVDRHAGRHRAVRCPPRFARRSTVFCGVCSECRSAGTHRSTNGSGTGGRKPLCALRFPSPPP